MSAIRPLTAFNKPAFYLALAFLLIGAFARIWMYGEAPPGIQHDEMFKAIEATNLIEKGDFRLFYPSNQGHEGSIVWWMAIAYTLVGSSSLMMRFPTLVFGMLTLALFYRVIADLYRPSIALIAMGLMSVSFWPIFIARVGFRSGTLPFFVLLVVWGLWRILYRNPHDPKPRFRTALWTGFSLGFALYTYASSFTLFLTYFAFLFCLIFLDKSVLKARWKELLIITGLALLMALPMVFIRLQPIGQDRASTISRPLQDLLAGQPQELIDNFWGLAGMFAFTGDPEWRYNIPSRPLFLLPIGLLVYVGAVIALLKSRRKPIHIFWLLLILFGVIPSLVTVSAPSFLRSFLIAPAIFLLIALALDTLSRFLPQPLRSRALILLAALVIIPTALADWNAYFHDWILEDQVHAIYRDDLEQLGRYLRQTGGQNELAFVSVVDPELDPLVYYFSDSPSPDEIEVVFFDSFANIVLSEQPALLFVSPFAPISPAQEYWLQSSMGTEHVGEVLRQDGALAFDIYQLEKDASSLKHTLESASQHPIYIGQAADFPDTPPAEWATPIDYPVNFGNLLQLRGIELPRPTIANTADGVNNQLFLQPLVEKSSTPFMIYLHLLDQNGQLIAQRDLMGVQPAQWNTDSIIMQDNFVVVGDAPLGTYILVMGAYNWQTNERYPILDAQGQTIADQIIIGQITITEPNTQD